MYNNLKNKEPSYISYEKNGVYLVYEKDSPEYKGLGNSEDDAINNLVVLYESIENNHLIQNRRSDVSSFSSPIENYEKSCSDSKISFFKKILCKLGMNK